MTDLDFVEKPISNITHVLRQLEDATKGLSTEVKVVETKEEVRKALLVLEKFDELALDCEGVKLGRKGKLTVLQLGAKDREVYVFDILRLGKDAFETGLKDLLESKRTVKITYDCRNDSDSLLHEYQVKLSNVLDMQLFEYICRKKAGKPEVNRYHPNKEVIRGMNSACQNYLEPNALSRKGILSINDVKNAGGSVMRSCQTVWRYRPLSEALKKYSAMDILSIWEIHHALTRIIPLIGIEKIRLEIASERYAGVRRDHDDVDQMFVRNSLLQSYVIPKICGNRISESPSSRMNCGGCKRKMPEVDSYKYCPDCKEVKRSRLR